MTFRVLTENRTRELGRSQEADLSKNNVRIYEKFTNVEQVSKISFFAGKNVKFSNLKNHEKMITETVGCEENEFGVSRTRKEIVLRGNYLSSFLRRKD